MKRQVPAWRRLGERYGAFARVVCAALEALSLWRGLQGIGLWSRNIDTRFPGKVTSKRGFTLVELLMVIAVTAILASLLLPALTKARNKAQGIYCMNNTRTLALTWLMYSHDNNDRLVENQNLGGPGEAMGSWITGFLTWDLASDNTNLNYLLEPRYAKLAQYMGNVKNIYKCPSDHFASLTQRSVGWPERVRSVAMNFYMGDGQYPGAKDWFPGQRVIYKKMSDFRKLPPGRAWVFVDEHPDSINDGALFTECVEPRWVDLPASYHNGACGFAYADGHSVIKRWAVGRTSVPIRYVDYALTGFYAGDDPRDIRWIQEQTTEAPEQ